MKKKIEKETLEGSVVRAMDGKDTDIFPFIPYIFRDVWELGCCPETVIGLISRHVTKKDGISFLDLGCGKGAVSIKVAKEFGYECLGIDAVGEFVDEARARSRECGVDEICRFMIGDIREEVKLCKDTDIIVLGSIGPVFGDYFSTLTVLSKVLIPEGLLIIDDGYIDGNRASSSNLVQKRSHIMEQIRRSGMKLVEEKIGNKSELENLEQKIFGNLRKRCIELIELYPEKAHLFEEYIRGQKEEGDFLLNEITCSTMAIRWRGKA